MKTLLVLLALPCAVGAATIEVPDEVAEHCNKVGCTIVPNHILEALLKRFESCRPEDIRS